MSEPLTDAELAEAERECASHRECDSCCEAADWVPALVAEVRRLRLNWTKAPPTGLGWYWGRVCAADTDPQLIEVTEDAFITPGAYEWAGPLEPPP